jgi:hypothetical protein
VRFQLDLLIGLFLLIYQDKFFALASSFLLLTFLYLAMMKGTYDRVAIGLARDTKYDCREDHSSRQ